MFFYTDTADAPWTVVKSNDKKRARLEAMRHVLNRFDYDDKDLEVVGTAGPADRRPGGAGGRGHHRHGIVRAEAVNVKPLSPGPGRDYRGRTRERRWSCFE